MSLPSALRINVRQHSLEEVDVLSSAWTRYLRLPLLRAQQHSGSSIPSSQIFYDIYLLQHFSVKSLFSKLVDQDENTGSRPITKFLSTEVEAFRLSHNELQRQDGKLAIVTGGSRGIGLKTVEELLSYGYSVIIGSSSSVQTREALQIALKSKFNHSSVEVWELDLSSLQSVHKFTDYFLSLEKPLHLLVNNAGILFESHEITSDGFERHFVVNYLSHCLLTALLLPRLQESASTNCCARIINTSSCVHFVGNINFADLQARFSYSKYRAYMQTKLAQVMFTLCLQSHLDAQGAHVRVNCVHPGVVNTDLMDTVWCTRYFGYAFLKNASEGAETLIYAALSSEMEGIGGNYLEECAIAQPSRLSQNAEYQKALWKETWNMLQPWVDGIQNIEQLRKVKYST